MSRDDDRSDRPERPERERLSWREIDQRRDKARTRRDPEPRGPGDRARSEAATKQYLKQIDGMFSNEPGGADGARLAREVRDAHGTPGLAAACRSYRDGIGVPSDPALLSMFLDCADTELVVAALEALREGHRNGSLVLSAGQRTQARILALGADDAVAEAAEELLDEL